MTPEQHLWQAVVYRALLDATARDPRVSEDIKAKREADAWLRGGTDFAQVCNLAGMDPHFVRDAYRSGRINPELLRARENAEATS